MLQSVQQNINDKDHSLALLRHIRWNKNHLYFIYLVWVRFVYIDNMTDIFHFDGRIMKLSDLRICKLVEMFALYTIHVFPNWKVSFLYISKLFLVFGQINHPSRREVQLLCCRSIITDYACITTAITAVPVQVFLSVHYRMICYLPLFALWETTSRC